MKKFIVLAAAIMSIAICQAPGITEEEFVWENISRESLNINAILVERDNPKIIYAGTNNIVIKTEDSGKNWQTILSIKGQNSKINSLISGYRNPDSIYAASGNGLFYSPNQGKNWRKIFKGKDYLESYCSVVWAQEKTVYLGTKKGLFISKDAGQSWNKAADKLANSRILSIIADPNEFKLTYAACDDGVFMTKDGGHIWEKIFFANSNKDDTAAEELNPEDNTDNITTIKHLITDPNNPNCLYLSTSKGIYKNCNTGINWDLLPNYGLLNIKMNILAIYADSTLYAASKSGIFRWTQEKWQEISLGLTAEDITAMDFDNHGNLYAASNKGIFIRKNKFTAEIRDKMAFYSENEPKIKDVQEAAIIYAEVSPEKIMRWRKQAQKMAFLPKVSTGMNRNTSDLRHWETGSTTKIGDDILNKGQDTIDWEVSFSWDLSQLIWNNDQTSIDARSRLMVELRDNILDEVTKLYFERLRIKMELNNLSIEDNKKRREKELKLQEITALLDALTGGYFSQQITE